jgi:nucleoside-diphosphate-sugar epimerase/glutathionylspermidine synthase
MDTTILVTGATGFVGGAVAAELLQRPMNGRVLLLIRGATPGAALERAKRSLARFGGSISERAWPRCEVLAGDLTEPATLADARLERVTHVIHAAGDTSLRSVRRVRDINIAGTLALVRRMLQAPRLVRFLHVGTAYICGADPPSLVHEDDYPAPAVRHLLEYTRSKAECEQLLASSVPELPLVIARPSVVVGHTRLGCGPSASIFWYYRTVDLLRRVPAPLDARKDVVPVDYVAGALLHLLFHEPLRWRRYHISAGESASVTWREMAGVFARFHGERPENPYERADFSRLVRERGRLRQLLGPGDEELLLRALEPFFLLSASGAEMFDNRRLLAEGMQRPPRFTDYLPACIRQSARHSVYEQILHDVWSSSVPALPWRCGEPLTPDRHEWLLRRAVFDCCKWNTQVGGRPLVCPFPLILDGPAWDQVARLAAELARETLTAEAELLERPDLHVQLGLPRALRRGLQRIGARNGNRAALRVLRFDFHWTGAGWCISEANTDVAGGFIEASGVTQLFAACYPGCHTSGDPAGVLSEAVQRHSGDGGRTGLLHLSAYSEDRQTMLYLARRLEERGVRPCLLGPAQLKWRGGRFDAACDWDHGPLDSLFRFLPAEWLAHMLPARTWHGLGAAGSTVLCNPIHAVLTQSKRFPLVWDRLEARLHTWRTLLPETRSPAEAPDLERGDWVLKPALGHEGHNVRLHAISAPDEWQRVLRSVRRRPDVWAAQRRFDPIPLPTPEGLLYPCLGVYVIDGRVAGCYGRLASEPLIDERSREVAVLVRAATTSVPLENSARESRSDL